MRTVDQKLRKCPVCAQDTVAELGIRDYSRWLSDILPGKVGGSDLDCVLHQWKTKRFLLIESSETQFIPRGKALMYGDLVAAGWDVWVVNDKDFKKGEVHIAIFQDADTRAKWRKISVEALKGMTAVWWESGLWA